METKEILNNHFNFTKQIASVLLDYYKGNVSKEEVLGTAVVVSFAFKNENLLPNLQIEWYLEWLNGLPSNPNNGLAITSSGSFWTAIWDVDYVTEEYCEDDPDAVDDFIASMDAERIKGYNRNSHTKNQKS